MFALWRMALLACTCAAVLAGISLGAVYAQDQGRDVGSETAASELDVSSARVTSLLVQRFAAQLDLERLAEQEARLVSQREDIRSRLQEARLREAVAQLQFSSRLAGLRSGALGSPDQGTQALEEQLSNVEQELDRISKEKLRAQADYERLGSELKPILEARRLVNGNDDLPPLVERGISRFDIEQLPSVDTWNPSEAFKF